MYPKETMNKTTATIIAKLIKYLYYKISKHTYQQYLSLMYLNCLFF